MKVKHTLGRKVENYEEKLNILILGKKILLKKGKKQNQTKIKMKEKQQFFSSE